MAIGERSCGIVPLSKRLDGILEVLCIQHASTGVWAFPKGHSEPGETQLETAERELLEETGLRLSRDEVGQPALLLGGCSFCYTFLIPRTHLTKECTYYVAAFDSQDYEPIRDEEIRDSSWWTVEQAAESLSFKEDKKMLTCILEHALFG